MSNSSNPPLTIALSKGRILEETLPLLEQTDLMPAEDVLTTRQLVVDGPRGIRFLIIRAADVCTFVERGAADLGIVGRDLLLEHRPHVYEPLDLGIGRCRLCVASPQKVVDAGKPQPGSRIRIATKYDHLAEQHFLAHGIQAEIIHLYGSMELAPLVGIADRIVDLVSTGGTLKANGLVEEETLYDISSRLVANPASFATRRDEIHPIVERFSQLVNGTQ
ncbi:MAG TPA: ATP phosphoribosyltransferase [Mariprofundaceae bacterium]|nr:ATP phosphoribosyltransferase [Mariprofundaceae bacterium]